MTEYIEREALMRQIKEIHCADCNSYHGVRCRACWVDDTLGYIDSEPAADVEPVVHAHWQPYEDTVQCSACGFGTFMDGYFFVHGECTHAYDRSFRFSFCPNCGAKMDESVGISDRLEEGKE